MGIVVPYINRDGVPQIRIAQSLDHGKTWKDVLTVYTYERNTKTQHNGNMNDVFACMVCKTHSQSF